MRLGTNRNWQLMILEFDDYCKLYLGVNKLVAFGFDCFSANHLRVVSHHVSLCCLFAGAWEWPSHPVWEWLQFLVPSCLHRVDRGCLHHAEVWGLRWVGLRQVPVHQKHSPCEVQAIACFIMKYESPHLHASPPWHNRYWPLDLDRISYILYSQDEEVTCAGLCLLQLLPANRPAACLSILAALNA